MTRDIFILPLLVALVLIQISLIAPLTIIGPALDLVFIFIFFLPFFSQRYLLWAGLTGFLMDLSLSPFLGFYVLVFMIIGLVVKKSFQFFRKEQYSYFLAIFLASFIIYSFLTGLTIAFLNGYSFPFQGLWIGGILNLVLALPLFLILKKFNYLA